MRTFLVRAMENARAMKSRRWPTAFKPFDLKQICDILDQALEAG